MSEEKKERSKNINPDSDHPSKNGGHGHRPRHHHKHRGHRPQQSNPAENQQEVKDQQPTRQNSSNPNTDGSNGQKNQNKRQDNQPKKNNHRNQRGDRNQNREQTASAEPTLGFFDTTEDDAIFGRPLFSPQSNEKKKARTDADTSEIPKLSDDELFGTSHLIHSPEVIEDETVEIVGIRFKSGGKSYYFDPDGKILNAGEFAIVDTARGLEFGEVCLANKNIKSSSIVQPLRKVIRTATQEDIAHHESNKQREKDAFKIGLEKIAAHKLDMKLVEVQYSFDNSKLLFYFTSAGRVDFRELVRDLASVFKTRIELRQIGIRDEAKMLGGIGMCGRPLCCSKYLSNFAQVSIKMAKEQGLSLNSNKISGNCGRLMCCLNFENQVYLDEIKVTPMPGSIVKIGSDKGMVTDANPLTGMLKVHLDGAPEGEKVNVHRDGVTVISRKMPESTSENDSQEEIPEG